MAVGHLFSRIPVRSVFVFRPDLDNVGFDPELVERPLIEHRLGSKPVDIEVARRRNKDLLGGGRDVILAIGAYLKVGVNGFAGGPQVSDRIAKLVARLPTDATQVVWEPHGLWETDEAARAAKRLGVVLCVDAARDPVPAGPVAYVRLPQIGAARAYSESSLERVVDAIGERREAYVFIETTSALKECKALRKLTMGRSKKVGGGALVLRPKTAALRVRDDEQE